MGNAENGAQPQLSKRAQIANPFRAMVFGAMADEMIADGTDVVRYRAGMMTSVSTLSPYLCTKPCAFIGALSFLCLKPQPGL